MIRESIIKLSKKQNLTYLEAEEVMDEIMSGKATPVQMSAYLTALALKGETIDEITASAAGMRAHCIKLLHDMDVLEIVGTGGDGSNSFNISTTASLLQNPEPQMCWKLWALRSQFHRKKARNFWKKSESASCLHRTITLQ